MPPLLLAVLGRGVGEEDVSDKRRCESGLVIFHS
jgi:hypothetical protein